MSLDQVILILGDLKGEMSGLNNRIGKLETNSSEIIQRLKDGWLNRECIEQDIAEFEEAKQVNGEALGDFLERVKGLGQKAYGEFDTASMQQRIVWRFLDGVKNKNLRNELVRSQWMKDRKTAKSYAEVLKMAETVSKYPSVSGKLTVGFLGPQPYMKQALIDMGKRYNLEVVNVKGWEPADIESAIELCKSKGIQAVGGFAQKDALHHILINQGLGNVSISPVAFLYCMNKYLMRKLESNPLWFDWVDPAKETDDQIIAKIKEWPFMLKNTSLSLGRGIFRIKSPDQLRQVLKEYKEDKALVEEIDYLNKCLVRDIPANELPDQIPPFIAEHLVDMNICIEYCYEGYITPDGKIVHYALTEEVYFKNHQALGYITPPFNYPKEKAVLIERWIDDYMGKLSDLGYRGQFFNIELWHTPNDDIILTEINPRAAHSYHWNYLYSFGTSLYEDNIALAYDGTEPAITPWQMWKNGDVKANTLIALVTTINPGKVSDILDYDYVTRQLEENEGILVRHCKKATDVLTSAEVTAAGVMLLQIWVTGKTSQDCINKEVEIRSKIYKMKEDFEYPPTWQARSADKLTVGFLGPQPYMKQALIDMGKNYNLEVVNVKGWEPADIESAIELCKSKGIQAVGGFAQKDALHHILINQGLGNVSISPIAFLYCMNKYLMRKLESFPLWFDWVDPAKETDDQIIAKIKEWPFMLKNTSLSLGRGIFRIKSPDQLRQVLKEYKEDKALVEEIDYLNKCLVRDIPVNELPDQIPPFIAEHLVDMNICIEYCYEGYITPNGKIVHYALTEEVYFKNHQALGYITPPFNFPKEKAGLVERWIDDYMGKLSDLGYRGQFFNIELWHTPNDDIILTEINPRAAHSYHWNYLYSFGTSLYEDNIALAYDGSEPAITPWQMWKSGDVKANTLIALITTINPGKVSDILDYDYVTRQLEQNEGILVRHCKKPTDVLTSAEVTAAGVMLLQIWVTGRTSQDCINKEIEIRSKIYRMKEDFEYPPTWQAKKQTIGFLGPQPYMKQALVDMGKRFDVVEVNIKGWEPAQIDSAIALCQSKGIQVVGGFAQKDALHHILINQGLGNVSISRMAFLYCMNKYLMRKLESNPLWFDWVDPRKETDDQIIAKIKEWPFMLKNTSLSLGRGIFRIKSPDQLRQVLKEYKEDAALVEEIDYLNHCLTRDIPAHELPDQIPPFIAEHLVDMNICIEYCYEGYITPDGKIVHYALTEEVYFKNHQALGYITPPFNFPKEKAGLVESWIDDYMGRLSDLGYRGQFFNIELWHTPNDDIILTEINPRAAHSYHWNYLYSFGTSLYEDNIALAYDGSEPAITPWQMWKNGDVRANTLIALITTINPGKVSDILDYNYVINQLEKKEGILVRHCKKPTDVLTSAEVTAAGVMLLQIWVTGRTSQDCINKEIEIRSKIYRMKEDFEYPPTWQAKVVPKQTVGFLGPQPYMKQALIDMAKRYKVEEVNIKGWEPAQIASAIALCKSKGIEVVGGFAQKDALHHILINQGLGNVSISRIAFLYCMNKYLMRKLESNPLWFDWVDPRKETDDQIIAKIKEWPFMLKNTSLSLGRGIFRIKSPDQLRQVLKEYKEDAALVEEIDYLNHCLTRDIPAKDLPEQIPPFIAEHLVDMNICIEYCYEGYITPNGKIVHYALTEEVYFKNHQALGYITPPFNYPKEKAVLIERWIDDYMGKLSDLGYRGQFFNIELWHTPNDEIILTEINPRAAHSYHWNYLYSFGTSLYEDNIALAYDGSEPAITPWQMWKSGDVKANTLIALITTINPGRVSDILDYNYVVNQLEKKEGILVRHCKKPTDVLTSAEVTAAGVMLLQIWVTGRTSQDCINKEVEIRSRIYRMKEDFEYPPTWQAK